MKVGLFSSMLYDDVMTKKKLNYLFSFVISNFVCFLFSNLDFHKKKFKNKLKPTEVN